MEKLKKEYKRGPAGIVFNSCAVVVLRRKYAIDNNYISFFCLAAIHYQLIFFSSMRRCAAIVGPSCGSFDAPGGAQC